MQDSSGFAYKISDVGGGAQQRRPFDGFGIIKDKMVCWEAKRMKGVYAFNLKEVFEGDRGHQMDTFELFSKLPHPPHLWVILCCYVPRKSRVYTFSYELLKDWYEKGTTSITQDTLMNLLPYTTIKNKRIRDFILIDKITEEEIQDGRRAS